ncbi:hypothetical protein H4S06_005633, partial [Coemansia sp. BCRC 34490]
MNIASTTTATAANEAAAEDGERNSAVSRESANNWSQMRPALHQSGASSRVAISELVHHDNGNIDSFSSSSSSSSLADTEDDHRTIAMVEAAHALESLRGEENHQQLQKKQQQQQQQPLFIKRVQAIPLVNSALEIYGRSK